MDTFTAPPKKIFVGVNADCSPDGTVTPRAIIWEDGRRFEIEEVLSRCMAPALKVCGRGTLYTVVVGGYKRELFFQAAFAPWDSNTGRWFVECR